MRIRIQQLKLMRIHADPDLDPDPKPWASVYRAFAMRLAEYNCEKKININKVIKGQENIIYL
jgi:hypothetical protein